MRARLGLNLKKASGGSGLPRRRALPTIAGLRRTTIGGIERGVRNPTVLILDRIAKALKVPVGIQLVDEPKALLGGLEQIWRLLQCPRHPG